MKNIFPNRFFRKKNPSSLNNKELKIKFPFTGTPIPPTWKAIDRYPLNTPFAYAVIAQDPASFNRRYYLDEIALSESEAAIYTSLLELLESELTVPRSDVDPKNYFTEQAIKVLSKYSIKVSPISWEKILYFTERDLVWFGVLDGLMRDANIEDISVDGVGRPLFIYHRKYQNLETNIFFKDDQELDNLVTRLAHMAGRHVSTAFPLVQGTLPGKHRLAGTFRREVSPHGGTLTIRKFREDPITVIDMLNFNVINHQLAAYTWLLMENRATAIVVGSTGAGKTTLLNALLTLTRINSKIVTIEEVQEINIAHSNWVALLSRQSYAASEEAAKDVGLFDLVKAAMRMRPDILVVGEVRGEEAYVLFQAISTGHGGLCTLHADEVSSAVQRLTSKPMDVAPAFIPFLDVVFTVRRVSIPIPEGGFRTVRRVINVDEVNSVGDYLRVFEWDPVTDKQRALSLKNSAKLNKLGRDLGVSPPELLEEIDRRSMVLKWVQHHGIRNFKDLSTLFEEYVSRPKETYRKAERDLRGLGLTPLEMVKETNR
ncbi:MAG: type II/IV secretion system ATPase subunit [Thaumarchaeota archaeon]|nr:type II/IV secretion system ATPase subunit [Nitrososphaerota archaeon]